MDGPVPQSAGTAAFSKLYAMDKEFPGLDRPQKSELVAPMKGHIIAHAELVGFYER